MSKGILMHIVLPALKMQIEVLFINNVSSFVAEQESSMEEKT